jgi:hypothetical protein
VGAVQHLPPGVLPGEGHRGSIYHMTCPAIQHHLPGACDCRLLLRPCCCTCKVVAYVSFDQLKHQHAHLRALGTIAYSCDMNLDGPALLTTFLAPPTCPAGHRHPCCCRGPAHSRAGAQGAPAAPDSSRTGGGGGPRACWCSPGARHGLQSTWCPQRRGGRRGRLQNTRPSSCGRDAPARGRCTAARGGRSSRVWQRAEHTQRAALREDARNGGYACPAVRATNTAAAAAGG